MAGNLPKLDKLVNVVQDATKVQQTKENLTKEDTQQTKNDADKQTSQEKSK